MMCEKKTVRIRISLPNLRLRYWKRARYEKQSRGIQKTRRKSGKGERFFANALKHWNNSWKEIVCCQMIQTRGRTSQERCLGDITDNTLMLMWASQSNAKSGMMKWMLFWNIGWERQHREAPHLRFLRNTKRIGRRNLTWVVWTNEEKERVSDTHWCFLNSERIESIGYLAAEWRIEGEHSIDGIKSREWGRKKRKRQRKKKEEKEEWQ